MKEVNQLSLFCYVKPLFENIFRHFWPRQFKAQNTTQHGWNRVKVHTMNLVCALIKNMLHSNFRLCYLDVILS